MLVAVRLALVAVLLVARVAAADSWLDFKQRTTLELRAGAYRTSFAAAERVALSQWLQVGEGEKLVVVASPTDGLRVLDANGDTKYVRSGRVGAFRLAGSELAYALADRIEVVTLGGAPRVLAKLPGVRWLRHTSAGWLARSAAGLALVGSDGKVRNLAAGAHLEAVAVSEDRVVALGGGELRAIDVKTAAATTTKLPERARVLDAELSPDGRALIWATATHVYERTGDEPARKIADADRVTDLAFAPDGTSWLWSARGGGQVVTADKALSLPANAGRARFRQAGDELVIRNAYDHELWNPKTDRRTRVGRSDPAESVTWIADYAGSTLITLSTRTDPHVKKQMAPLD